MTKTKKPLKRVSTDPTYKSSDLARLQEFFEQIVVRSLRTTTPEDHVYGFVESSTAKAGMVFIKMVTLDGVRYYTASPNPSEDAQSDSPVDWGCETPARDVIDAPEPPLPTNRLWDRAKDESLPAHERVAALSELTALEDRTAADYVAAQLDKDTPLEDWQNALVFLAEQIAYPAAERSRIGERLLSIATRLRASTKAGTDKVVWSAMRRAATLLPPDPNRFVAFLDRKGAVDTRATALRCIQRMFEPAPPASQDAFRGVADRVDVFASKFLDPDVFAGGENALIGQNAIYALAALGDSRVEQAAARARSLCRRWMNRQLKTGLQQILAAWRSNGGLVQSHPAIVRVESIIGSFD